MELSERAIQSLEQSGCTSIYEQDWVAAQRTPLTAGDTPLHVYITEGALVVERSDQQIQYETGDRFQLSALESMMTQATEHGCRAVLGE